MRLRRILWAVTDPATLAMLAAVAFIEGSIMSSDNFKGALTTLIARKDERIAAAQAAQAVAEQSAAALQSQLDAANNQITNLSQRLDAVDAEDTQAIVDNTPAALEPTTAQAAQG